ncbi:CpsD/CapB family tyrosine-protein kinase [Bacillus pinisoli]|uniref:CpsD/CapB family tyrosine-protein kinase n=1 Tax=Bacillus pinisoli TaxID=2901866 RepID=UPI001FF4F32D|nr:CpsD/CapB family tyrosine-protein kinase [Bacillus pinisoli]
MLTKTSIYEKFSVVKSSTKKLIKKKKKRNLICYTSPTSKISEQFRTIRANLRLVMGEGKSQTLLITSSQTDEGKSTVLANLAVSMSNQKGKVLLVDANLRNPYIHTIFRFQNKDGLSTILKGEAELHQVVRYTGISNLDILPSGPIPTNPAEMLASKEMEDFLKNITSKYDMVLIDTPPVLESAETRVLANLCDGVVIIIQKGKTLLDKAIDAKKVLEFANAKLVGVILNEK